MSPVLDSRDAPRAHTERSLKRWNGSFFEKTTLQGLGLNIQLGHPVGEPCSNPVPARQRIVVIHTNGIHPATINYCGCDRLAEAGNHRQQLLRFRLFPATDQEPMTCATFAVLETVHMQTVQSKCGVYDLYMALEGLTDNTGLEKVRVSVRAVVSTSPGLIHREQNCYKAFSRMLREWKHLKLMKRAGRGNDTTSVDGTGPGELVVLCPACPLPGINLPEDWEDVMPELEYVYPYEMFQSLTI